MNEVTLRLLDDLSSALEKDERFATVRKQEEALSANDAVRPLLEEANKRREAYLTLRLERGEEDEATLRAKRDFHAAKLALEEREDVAAYRKSYAEADRVYREIDRILFGEYRVHASCKEKHAAR